MVISLTALIVWLLIAILIGFLGELIAGRRGPGGIVGAALIGFLAILLIVGVFHFAIVGEPRIEGVPFFSSVLVAAIISFLWSGFGYRRVAPYASRYYYRRGSYARHPRRRLFF